MKKILSLTLAVLLTMFSVQQTFAKTKEEKFTEKVKTQISKLGTGQDARIKLKLEGGAKVKGFVSEIGGNQFAVTNAETGQVTKVNYSSVKQVKGNNLSTGVQIAIAAAVALVFIIFLGSQLK